MYRVYNLAEAHRHTRQWHTSFRLTVKEQYHWHCIELNIQVDLVTLLTVTQCDSVKP